MSVIQWTSELDTGHPVIDGQHKRLIALVSELYSAIENHRSAHIIERALDEVTAYTASHFDTEERLMKKANYPGLEAHKILHDDLNQKAKLIVKSYKSGSISLSETLPKFLSDWVQNHILRDDLAFAAYLRKQRSEANL